MKLEELRAFKQQLESIAANHRACDLRVFGSVVRGEADEKSDVDFLVRMLPGASLMDIVGLEHSFTDLLGTKADVVPDDSIHPLIEPYIRRDVVPL